MPQLSSKPGWVVGCTENELVGTENSYENGGYRGAYLYESYQAKLNLVSYTKKVTGSESGKLKFQFEVVQGEGYPFMHEPYEVNLDRIV